VNAGDVMGQVAAPIDLGCTLEQLGDQSIGLGAVDAWHELFRAQPDAFGRQRMGVSALGIVVILDEVALRDETLKQDIRAEQLLVVGLVIAGNVEKMPRRVIDAGARLAVGATPPARLAQEVPP
jgi:hypothetical protein